MMREYTFDVKIFAEVSVRAESEEAARKAIANVGLSVTRAGPNGQGYDCPNATDGEPDLLRIDGEDVI